MGWLHRVLTPFLVDRVLGRWVDPAQPASLVAHFTKHANNVYDSRPDRIASENDEVANRDVNGADIRMLFQKSDT
jgi:hypothetical protein